VRSARLFLQVSLLIFLINSFTASEFNPDFIASYSNNNSPSAYLSLLILFVLEVISIPISFSYPSPALNPMDPESSESELVVTLLDT
jgi:hypothetical protein